MIVYIPTKARSHAIVKTLDAWVLQENLEAVILMVEPQDVKDYQDAIYGKYPKSMLFRLPKNDKGVNYCRNLIIKDADDNGLRRIVMSDDTIRPKETSDVSRLIKYKGRYIGMGMWFSIYGLFHGVQPTNKPYVVKSASCHRCFGISVGRTLRVGNFDPKFLRHGDDELHIRAVKGGYAWGVDPRVIGVASARGQEGGNKFTREREQDMKALLREKHPDCVTNNGSIQWKKIHG